MAVSRPSLLSTHLRFPIHLCAPRSVGLYTRGSLIGFRRTSACLHTRALHPALSALSESLNSSAASLNFSASQHPLAPLPPISFSDQSSWQSAILNQVSPMHTGPLCTPTRCAHRPAMHTGLLCTLARYANTAAQRGPTDREREKKRQRDSDTHTHTHTHTHIQRLSPAHSCATLTGAAGDGTRARGGGGGGREGC
eukprot:1773276-Rhodomonas_salina.1